VRETLLEVRDLTVVFPTHEGDVQAVSDLSYTLHRGETIGIVGESGSGKSVSSLALMGLLNQERTRISGEALFGGGTSFRCRRVRCGTSGARTWR